MLQLCEKENIDLISQEELLETTSGIEGIEEDGTGYGGNFKNQFVSVLEDQEISDEDSTSEEEEDTSYKPFP